MDEQMIREMARAMRPNAWAVWGERGKPPKIIQETLDHARAAHSVIAGKVAELTEVLREASGAMNEARLFVEGCEPYNARESVVQDKALARYDETLAALDAALAPYPERRSEP